MNDNICKFSPSGISNDLNISCFVYETDPAIMLQKTALPANRMILVECGEGEFVFDNSTFIVCAGSLIFGFEGEVFTVANNKNMRYIYVDFTGTRATTMFFRFGISNETRKIEGFNSIIPFCKESLLTAKQENIDITAESVLLYVFSRLSVNQPMQNDVIQKIIKYTEENFRDPELSLSLVADEIGYNAKYLSHFFKEKTNTTYREYLRSFRIKYAVSLFELGISSVKNVALLSGFSDPLYFSNTFKKEIGLSPREFLSKFSVEEDMMLE